MALDFESNPLSEATVGTPSPSNMPMGKPIAMSRKSILREAPARLRRNLPVRLALVMASSAFLSGIAVVLWHRRSLQEMQDALQSGEEEPSGRFIREEQEPDELDEFI